MHQLPTTPGTVVRCGDAFYIRRSDQQGNAWENIGAFPDDEDPQGVWAIDDEIMNEAEWQQYTPTQPETANIIQTIQNRHSPNTFGKRLSTGKPNLVCHHCRDHNGLKLVPWPCLDRQTTDGQKNTPCAETRGEQPQ